jgi:RND family efflux transporter MFP subunit
MIKLSRPQSLGLIAGATLIIAALVWVSASHTVQAAADNAGQKAVKAALTVSVTKAMHSEWPLTHSANGNITAWQEAIIGAEAAGLRLEEVLVNVGERVRKGQLLARLQNETVGAEVEQTRASLQEAVANQAEAAANADRARQLQATGAMSAQQINQFVTGEQTARARVSVLKAKLRADEIRLTQTYVKAPDDGSISARLATVGAVVQSGQELFRLIRRDRLEWRAEVPAGDLSRLKPGMKATIFTASGSPAPGVIRMVAPTVDAQTRNGLIYIDITQAQDAKAGMFARGEIQLGNAKALTLPQSAVQMRDGFHYVFRVGDDNKVIQTKVVVGRRADDRIEIASGIDATQRVVSSGVGFLADGDTVRVVEAPAPTGLPASGKAS